MDNSNVSTDHKMSLSDNNQNRVTMEKSSGKTIMENAMKSVDPQAFPVFKKVHASVASFFSVFALLYAATVAAPVVPALPMALNTSRILANLVFSAPFFGVFFAPIFTPHVSELVGRKPVYIGAVTLLIVFIAGISQAKTITQLIVLRVFAGLVGGPTVVLIEGTHADVWPAVKTVSYYCSIALAQYWGAAFGPIIGAQGFLYGGPPWNAYTALIIACFAWLLVVSMPETYQRQLYRRLKRKDSNLPPLDPALNGTTLAEMANLTVVTPLLMAVSEPLVIMGGLLLGLTFATVFQLFISVPFVLASVYNLGTYTIGLAFFSAVAGSALAFVTSLAFDAVGSRMTKSGRPNVEARLFSAMLGVCLTMGALFWIAWTAKPTIHYIVPVTATAFHVWGNMSILLSIVSYFFDAFHPQGILSALTAMACFRVACGGLVSLFILDMFNTITPAWSLSTFGFINVLFIPIPFIMYFFGETLRTKSRFMKMGGGGSPMMMQGKMDPESSDGEHNMS